MGLLAADGADVAAATRTGAVALTAAVSPTPVHRAAAALAAYRHPPPILGVAAAAVLGAAVPTSPRTPRPSAATQPPVAATTLSSAATASTAVTSLPARPTTARPFGGFPGGDWGHRARSDPRPAAPSRADKLPRARPARPWQWRLGQAGPIGHHAQAQRPWQRLPSPCGCAVLCLAAGGHWHRRWEARRWAGAWPPRREQRCAKAKSLGWFGRPHREVYLSSHSSQTR